MLTAPVFLRILLLHRKLMNSTINFYSKHQFVSVKINNKVFYGNLTMKFNSQ